MPDSTLGGYTRHEKHDAACGHCYGWSLDSDACDQEDPTGEFLCTRPRGHDLPHVACTYEEHMEKVWPEKAALDTKVRECPDKDVHWRYDEAQETIQRLTKERDEAREALDRADAALAGASALIEKYESRPLTPDAITDEMVERALASFEKDRPGIHHFPQMIRSALTAALTEPPARPEGAEELGRALMDAHHADSNLYGADDFGALADFLVAERGVRVVGEERS